MIESIDIDGNRMDMLPVPREGGQHYRIYKADSLNVIIGNNGSGKTRALRRICNAMSHGGETLGCQINFAGHEDAESEVQEYGVIYYTSIPYHVHLPENGPRFKNASLDFAQNTASNEIDMEHFAHLSKTLGMRTRPLITMSYDEGLIVPMLARGLVRCINQSEVDPARLGNNFPVDEIARNSTGILKALGLRYPQPSTEEIRKRKISDHSMFIANLICRRIVDLVRMHHGVFDLPAFSAVEAVAEGRNDLTAVAIVFFKEVLDIDLGPASRFPKVEVEIRQRLKEYFEAKTRIFEAGRSWDRSEQAGVIAAKTEYEDSEILKRYPADTMDKFVVVEWGNFSSGQLALLYQFTAIHRAARELKDAGAASLLLLLDEGDIFLHANWQRRYMELLDDFIGKLRKDCKLSAIQIVLTTHSSTVITDVPSDFILRLNRNGDTEPRLLSFAASPQDIVNSSFNADSIGSFAEKILTKTAKNIRAKRATARDDYIISLIDDPIIKNEFKRLRSNHLQLSRSADDPWGEGA